MFRPMRRFKQLLSDEDTRSVLERGTSGVLAVLGDEGYPYAVPLSYAYLDGKLYFHCAKAGHKLDALRSCPKVSFCVTDQDQVVAEEYTTYFRSAIAFGRVRILDDPEEMLPLLHRLARKYAPEDSDANRTKAIDRELAQTAMLELTVEHLTGKEAIELVRARQKS